MTGAASQVGRMKQLLAGLEDDMAEAEDKLADDLAREGIRPASSLARRSAALTEATHCPLGE